MRHRMEKFEHSIQHLELQTSGLDQWLELRVFSKELAFQEKNVQ